MLAGVVPSLRVTAPNQQAVDIADGFASYSTPVSVRGSSTKFELSDHNATIGTLLVREQESNDQCPVHLPNGAAQRDKVAHHGSQQFYVFQVPAGFTGGITITLESLQVSHKCCRRYKTCYSI